MATIKLSALAPQDETIHFSFAGGSFDLGASAKQTFDTSDPDLLSNAGAHPWLEVEVVAAAEAGGQYLPGSLDPTKDAQSRFGPNALLANDPAEVKKAEDAKADVVENPVAIEAGLDQNAAVTTGEFNVAETLAADEDHEAAKSATPFKAADPAPDAPAADPAPSDSDKVSN